MTALKTLRKWNKEGSDAQKAGLALNNNPYDAETDAYRCWIMGYINAMGFRGGDCVRVKRNAHGGFHAGVAFITNLHGNTPGGVALDREIGGCRYWNIGDLVKVDLNTED